MTEFPSLAEIAEHHNCRTWQETGHCDCGEEFGAIDYWARHIADAWREACTIRTVEELDALPSLSVVLGALGGGIPWHKSHGFWWPASASGGPRSADMIKLPALLIWSPDWERP